MNPGLTFWSLMYHSHEDDQEGGQRGREIGVALLPFIEHS
jgi:hypothetical protein